MQKVTCCFGRNVEKVVSVSFAVGEFEGRGPAPAKTGELKVGGGDGAFGSAPRRGEGVGARGVASVDEVRGA